MRKIKSINLGRPFLQVAVLSMPPLGEHLDSEMNIKVRRWNRALEEACHEVLGSRSGPLTDG